MEPAGIVVAILGLLIIGLGLWGMVSPTGLVGFARGWMSQHGMGFAVGTRLVGGVALWLAAPASRNPAVFQVLAVLMGVAGLSLPLIGVERFRALIDWVTRAPVSVIRVWTLAAGAFGAYLIWAAQGGAG